MIAAVNGHALGYGASIVSYCDLAIAGESATFGFPEIRNNIIPATATVKTGELISRRMMAEMVLMGKCYSAADAKQMGLINAVTKDDETLSTAMRWAEQLAENDVMTNMLCKQYLQSVITPGYEVRALGSIGVLGMGYINKNESGGAIDE